MQSLKQRREEQRPIVVRGSQIAARIRARRSQACPPARTVCEEQARFARSRQRTRPCPHEAAASRISFIIRATSETSIYISPNSFPGLVVRQKKPWCAASFCRRHRGIVSFSGKIFNTIEKVTPHFAKVPCFLGPFATRVGPGRHRTDKTRHFRHMRPHFLDSVGNVSPEVPTLSGK